MNDELRSYYRSEWKQLASVRDRHEALSQPLLLKALPGFSEATVKLLVVGQQTHGWGTGSDTEGHPLDKLMQNYENFALGRSRMNTPFWQAAHQVHEAVNPSAPRTGFMWSNLVKVDQNKDRPSREVEEKVSSLNLLPAEVRIVDPDAVVFFTGPDYVSRLRDTFEGAQREEVSEHLFQIDHELLPSRSFQTYHPKYLRLKGNWSIVDQVANRIRE